jgi:hypothetical protein
MMLRVTYRIDAHDYSPRRASCSARCAACRQDAAIYRSAAEAEANQPMGERILEDGDQGSLERPARRFTVVVSDFFA